MKPPKPPRGAVWATLLAAGLAYETAQVRADGPDTLSGVVRWVLRTHTRQGRMVFLMVWSLFAAWFALHIVGGKSWSPRVAFMRKICGTSVKNSENAATVCDSFSTG